MKPSRLLAHRYGIHAEKIAALYLRCKGYRVIAARLRNPYGEIDLLVKRGRTFAAVEVKARKNFQLCEDSVPPWKRQKIARAMEAAMANGKIAGLVAGGNHNIRFDVVWIVPWAWPRHIPDAWRM